METSAEKVLEAIPIPGQPKADPAKAAEIEAGHKERKAKEKAERSKPPADDPLKEAKEKFRALLKSQETDEQKAENKARRKERAKTDPMVFEDEDDEGAPAGAEALKPINPTLSAKAERPPETETEVKERAEVEKLRAKLVLAGAPRKVTEHLSGEEVREWWQRQEERERAQALALQRASEAEKQVEALKKTTDKSEPLAGVPTDDSDLEEVAANLSEQFGEEEGKALAQALKSVTEPLRRESAQIKAILQAAKNKGEQDISARNRARLGEKLSHLKENDRAWTMIHGQVLQAFQKDPQRYSSAEEAYDDVFESIYGGLLKEKPAEEDAAQAKQAAKEKAQIAASLPTAPSGTKAERVYTQMDAHKAAFRHLYKHPGDVEGARRQISHLNVQ